MVGNVKENYVSKRASRESFVMLKPDGSYDVDKLAKTIALCENVSKVVLTSGEYAFVAEMKGGSGSDHQVAEVLKKFSKGMEIHSSSGHITYRAVQVSSNARRMR
ncbi:MAG: hypothetical protein ACP5MK_03575 [Candidatus Micrarchaeia archaeon]